MTSNPSAPLISAFQIADAASMPATTRIPVSDVTRDHAIWVERADSKRLEQIDPEWADLVARASEPNVFMHPAVLQSLGDNVVTLLAWQATGSILQLVGIWAFVISRLAFVQVLRSPTFAHAYLATPVIDREREEGVLAAMLDYIQQTRGLPKLISLDPIRLDGPTMRALSAVARERGGASRIITSATRPVLLSDLDGKQYFEKALSSSSRKKLRQHRRRLEEKGALDCVIHTAPNDVEKAFEDFLKLEQAGWKGQRGTALLSHQSDADVARKMIAGLTKRGAASIHAIYQHGKLAAAQLVWRAGAAAFTWKTAYDEALGDYSPGMLLLENYTTAFLADKSIAVVDSCAFDDSGFMSVWQERQAIGQVLISSKRGGSVVFEAIACLQAAFLRLRTAAKQLYLLGGQWTRK
jgi:CelD/BcsL family acetyltransferase involved in cellulose biosynthesis